MFLEETGTIDQCSRSLDERDTCEFVPALCEGEACSAQAILGRARALLSHRSLVGCVRSPSYITAKRTNLQVAARLLPLLKLSVGKGQFALVDVLLGGRDVEGGIRIEEVGGGDAHAEVF